MTRPDIHPPFHGRLTSVNTQVLVLGSANADLVVTAEHRPAGGETVLGGDTQILPGGKGANTAVASARLGANTALLGAVGNDGHGRILLESLHEAGVSTDLVRRVERPTGVAYITVTPDGENAILVSPGANHALQPHDVEELLPDAGVLVCSLETPIPVVEHAVRRAAAEGIRSVLNLSPVTTLSPDTLTALDVLLVNEHEAAWLLGDSPVEPMRLLELGPERAVITMGSRGALVVGPQGAVELTAPEVSAVDTTGAGDAFAGALASALVRDVDLVAAAEEAVRVAAISVTGHGAQPSYPTRAELWRDLHV